ncbi:MAG: hypothetical protein M3133_05120 [Actinomycetota bacterium]|nr:hypothetical protein [Actinomycetota bacterium]
MGWYAPCPSPQRVRQASLLILSLAGASTGLLAGLGWRLFEDGSRDLAVGVWLVSTALVIVYLLVALLARVIAVLIESRWQADFAPALRHLQDRVEDIEREHGGGRGSVAKARARVLSSRR